MRHPEPTDMPERWIPSLLKPQERPKPEPRYAVGVQIPPNEFGMIHGPFRELEEALEVMPSTDVELQFFVLRLDGSANSDRLYMWEGNAWIRCEPSTPDSPPAAPS